jgi:hypothetical protein
MAESPSVSVRAARVRVELSGAKGPATTVMYGRCETPAVSSISMALLSLMRALTCAGVPARRPVKVAAYPPPGCRVAGPMLPALVPPLASAKVTVTPEVIGVPAWSTTRAVRVVLVPAATVSWRTATVDCCGAAGSGRMVTVGYGPPTATPFRVAPMATGVPAAVEVNCAV